MCNTVTVASLASGTWISKAEGFYFVVEHYKGFFFFFFIFGIFWFEKSCMEPVAGTCCGSQIGSKPSKLLG